MPTEVRSRPTAAFLLVLMLGAGCGGGQEPGAVTVSSDVEPMQFSLVTISGERLDALDLRGRATVVLVFASYDVTSQLVASRVEELRHTFKPRINAVGVALEPPKNRMLVEAFAAAIDLGFPVAMADYATLQGRGPFGNVQVVPLVIVLDSRGRPIWRGAGPVESNAIEQALAKATSGRDAPAVQEVPDK